MVNHVVKNNMKFKSVKCIIFITYNHKIAYNDYNKYILNVHANIIYIYVHTHTFNFIFY